MRDAFFGVSSRVPGLTVGIKESVGRYTYDVCGKGLKDDWVFPYKWSEGSFSPQSPTSS